MDDNDAMPWLHCPVIDDGTAPLPREYYAGLLSSSNFAVRGTGGEGVTNFTFFSRPHAPTAVAAVSTAVPKAVTQTQHGLQPPPDPTAWASSVVCSGNGHHQPAAECSASPDEDMDDDEPGAARWSAAAARGTKRSRTAEVHNLSERRRRDRINEKMRALQELIPNCSKIDKASMLEEAIEYLKTLQLQVQTMSMGTAGLCMPPAPTMLMQMQATHLGFGMGGQCPVMAMPHGSMFGMMLTEEQREAAAAAVPAPPGGGGGAVAGDHVMEL